MRQCRPRRGNIELQWEFEFQLGETRFSARSRGVRPEGQEVEFPDSRRSAEGLMQSPASVTQIYVELMQKLC